MLFKNKSVVITLALLIATALWVWVVAPMLLKLPSDFHYQAEVLSIDNLYDEARETYSGGSISITQFSYDVIDTSDSVLLIKNIFDVRTIDNEKIFSVERLYGIDPKTGKHVEGHGDKDRDGYLFGPIHANAGQPYTYWHINYDEPARMEFKEIEEIAGLVVYRYETDYHADQTKDLAHLPGVPEERGVNLDINLQMWIEPVTGHLVKYEDQTIAYYYDIGTGERIAPWNKFHNRYSQSAIAEHVRLAQRYKTHAFIIKKLVPISLLILTVISFCISLISRRRNIAKNP